jgi:hypothetical protein
LGLVSLLRCWLDLFTGWSFKMTKEEMVSLLGGAGVEQRIIDAMEHAYEMGVEFGEYKAFQEMEKQRMMEQLHGRYA